HSHYAGAQSAATAADIDRIVQRLRESLDPKGDTVEDIPRFDTNLAYQLYSLLLKPVEASWRPAKSLIMVMNGALGFLPIALLPTSPVAVLRTDRRYCRSILAAARAFVWVVPNFCLFQHRHYIFRRVDRSWSPAWLVEYNVGNPHHSRVSGLCRRIRNLARISDVGLEGTEEALVGRVGEESAVVEGGGEFQFPR